MVQFTCFAIAAAFSVGNVVSFAPTPMISSRVVSMPERTALKMSDADDEVIMNRYSR
jgi:hypothetical protein